MPKYRDKKSPLNLSKWREIIRTQSIDINKLKGWENVTKLYYNLACKPPKQKILYLYYRFTKNILKLKLKHTYCANRRLIL